MKWSIGTKQKIKTAWLFAFVFILILMKNLLDKKNVSDLGDTFAAVYEDRLLAESYLFKISDQLYRKKILLEKAYKNSTKLGPEIVEEAEKKILALVADFEKTKFTKAESRVFKTMKENIAELHEYEDRLSRESSMGIHDVGLKNIVDDHFYQTVQSLHNLSEIQLDEGKDLNEDSRKIIAGNTILTNFEFGLLILVGILVQALIFASKAIFPKTLQNHHMN